VELDRDLQAHYAEGRERGRLTSAPSLELVRTQVLLARFLPAPPARVLDVGGGPGVHATWLAGRGYDVELVDPVRLHVEQATAAGLPAAVGDARDLDRPDASFDAVLLLGPLYHLVDPADRSRALREARRVVRPGGVVLAAAISRYASTFDGFFAGLVDAEGFPALMREDLRTGQHRNPGHHPDFFTTAYFHGADDLGGELAGAGWTVDAVLPVEGPLHWAPALARRLADPGQMQLVLDVLERVERDPRMTNATAHLLAVGHRPG
jgi:SAM-dependent methyltransferase